MKISKPTWIFLASGILVILVATLGMAYFNQYAQKSRLNEDIPKAQLRLKEYPAQLQQLSSEEKRLESKLAKAESELVAAEANLDQSTESIEARDAVLMIAQDCNVEVTEFSSQRPTSEILEGVPLSTLQLTVTVEGELLNLIYFIYQWIEEYPTGIVEIVEITVPESPYKEVEVEEEGGTGNEIASATIDLLIYSYEGG